MPRIGLVAGAGRLPVIFLRLAKDKGDTVIAFGVKGLTDKDIEKYADKVHWLDWGALQKGALLLVTERIRKIIMLGKINKEVFFKGDEKMDEDAKKILDKINDRKDYSILNEVAKFLSKVGVEVVDSTTYLNEFLPSKGVLTKRAPSKDEWEDINYGKEAAKEISKFDIGQTVAVKDKTVIAIEAIEGTDEVIKRAGSFVKGGFVVVKVSRPNQDLRFDVPVVGLDTLKAIHESGGTALALEEKRTLLIETKDIVKFADDKEMAIVVI